MDVRSFNKVLPYLFGDEIDYLERLAKQYNKNSHIVMLGIGPGMMALSLLSGNSELIIQGYDTENFTGIIHVDSFGHCGHLIPVKAVSWEAADKWKNESIDLLLVDACHDFDCVDKDIQAWYPKVKQDGIFFFHGYKTPKGEYGPVSHALAKHDKLFNFKTAEYVGISIVLKKCDIVT